MPNSYPQTPDYGGGSTGRKKTSLRKFPMSPNEDYRKVNRKKANQQSVGRVKPIVRQF